MKKLIISAMAILLVMVNLQAQNLDNRITVSTSDNLPLLLGSMISSGVIGSLTEGPAGSDLGNVSSHGCFSIGYNHFVSSKFAVGGELTYAGANLNFKDSSTHKVISSETANIFMLMATGKCNYFKKNWFTLGGDLGIGVMSDFKKATSLAFQIDPLCFRFGSDKIAAFLSAGFGVKGIFTLGIDIGF